MATLTLSKATIADSAPSGSVIGAFNVSGLQVLQTDPSVNYFSVSGKNLIGKWTSPPTAGTYKIWVFVTNSQPAAFNVTITAAAKKPTPTSVTLTPASASVPDNSAAGMLLSKIAVKMSDGSTFAGTLTIPQNALVVISGASMVLKRALVAGDDGAHKYTVTATQNGASASATLPLTVTAVAPPPRTLVLSLASPPQIPDNSPSGTLVSTATVKYSDGTQPAAVTLTSSDTTIIVPNGMNLVLARALTSADDTTPTHPALHVTITASDGLGLLAAARLFGGAAGRGDETG